MGKGFFNSLKSAFVTEVASETQSQINKKSEETPKIVQEEKVSVSNISENTKQAVVFSDGKVEGQVDYEILNTLCSVIENSREMSDDCPTYMDLKSAANDSVMKESIPDENLRFTCAFVTMKVNNQNLTKDKILDNIDKCIEIVENEKNNGMQQLSDIRKVEVDDKEGKIKEKTAELNKKQEEIAKIVEEINSLNGEVTKSKNEIAIKSANFTKTVNFLVDSLVKDKEKLSKILN